MDNLVGQTIKGYELRQLIGMGRFGAVYRSFQAAVSREVAIKVILPESANQPEFIRRFEVEAQVVARLEHPHIVPLYDYWREPDGAFLVMRFLRGGSLRSSIKKGAWPPEKAALLLDQIASALALAHRNGVVHRDIKPDNILMDDEGNAYLADFGIAKDMTISQDDQPQEYEVSGSAEYFSPEQINCAEITPQTDLYCLGVVMYEVLTGSKPFKTSNVSQLFQRTLNDPLPPLYERAPMLPDMMDDVIQKATQKDPSKRYADVMSFAAAFRQALSAEGGISPELLEEETGEIANPYKGLRAFQEADAGDFFGREALTDQLLQRLTETGENTHFLAVVGPSGSGKSSVVKAGLIPTLRLGGIPNSKNWYIIEMVPGTHPIEKLQESLLHVAVDPPADLLEQLQKDKHGLLNVTQQILPDSQSELLIVVDQFEETFTLVDDEAARKLFLESIMTAISAPDSRLWVIVTLRADFYDRPLTYLGFGELMRKRTEVVIPLSPEELERAIVGPADRVGVRLEADLISAIQKDVGDQPGILPLLQYAMTELFERRQGRVMTFEAYQNSGGVTGALARRAEELFTGLDQESQESTRQLFLRLVTLGEGVEDTRRRMLLSEIATLRGSGEKLTACINDFVKYRLLTIDRDPVTRGPTIEVAHEALIRTWKRLREWLSTSRGDLRLQQRLAAASTEWLNSNRDRSFLMSGSRLAQFEGWITTTELALNETEAEYLNASIAERKAKEAIEEKRREQELILQRQAANRLRYLVVFLAAFLVVAIGLSAFAFNQRQVAEGAKQDALNSLTLSESLRLAVEASNLLQKGNNAELAALLSIYSVKKLYTGQGDDSLLYAADFDYAKVRMTGHELPIYRAVFSPDDKYVLTGAADKTARLWDIKTGKQIQQFDGHTDIVYDLAYSPDGKYVFTISLDKTSRLWDVQTGKEVRQFVGQDRRVWSAAYSPDGQYVVSGFGSGLVWMWNAATGDTVCKFEGHEDYVLGAVFSADGKYLLTGAGDNTARLWDVKTCKQLQKFSGHTNLVQGVAFAPDGKSILTGSWDKTVRLWDIQTGKELRLYPNHTDKIYNVQFTPDGLYLLAASEDKTARLLDVKTGQEIQRFANDTQGIQSAGLSHDGKLVVTGGKDLAVRVWDVHTGTRGGQFIGSAGAILSLAISPDGKYVMTGGDDRIARLWDVETGQLLKKFTAHADTSGDILSITFSPDGKYAITAANDRITWLWDLQTGKGIHSFHEDPKIWDWMGQSAFSPDGRYILTSSKDKTVRIWNVQTFEEVKRFTMKAGAFAAAYSPDGKTVASGDEGGALVLWDVQSGHQIREFVGHQKEVFRVAFSPDGKYLLSGSTDTTVRLWDVQTGKELHSFPGHVADAEPWVAFSPDGKLILTGNHNEGGATLWDAQTYQELRHFISDRPIRTVAFSPDGKSILMGGNNNEANMMPTDYRDLILDMCDQVQREFSPEERTRYGIKDNEPSCAKFGTQTYPLAATSTPIQTATIPALTWTFAEPTQTPKPTTVVPPTVPPTATPNTF